MVRAVRATLQQGGITVSWTHDESGPPENFELQVQPDGGQWSPLAVVPYVPGQPDYSYLHESPVGSGVRYQVRASNEAGSSQWVESNRVPLVVVPNAPMDVTATA